MRKRFKIADTFQHMVGGFLLAGPFVVTEEVWTLAAEMKNLHAVILVGIIMTIGYAALYKADRGRDLTKERRIFGVPLRFISLVGVSFSSVFILIYLFSAQQTFGASNLATAKAAIIGSIFSIIGAATADSVFPSQIDKKQGEMKKAA